MLIANNPPPSLPPSDTAPSDTASTYSQTNPTPADTVRSSTDPTLNESNEARFRLVLTPAPTTQGTLLGLSSPRFASLPIGKRVEVSHAAYKAARKVGELLSGGGRVTEGDALEGEGEKGEGREGARKARKGHGAGAGLVVDYGADSSFDNSFRAFKDHALVDPFHRPGECDLTANVDFAYLREAFASLPDTNSNASIKAHGPLPQGAFLTRMGLHARIAALARSQPSRAGEIKEAGDRLVDEGAMGNEYKVLGITMDGELGGGEEVWPFVELGESGIGEGVD